MFFNLLYAIITIIIIFSGTKFPPTGIFVNCLQQHIMRYENLENRNMSKKHQEIAQRNEKRKNMEKQYISGPQPCPVNPMIFMASESSQYISSPYDLQTKQYIPNCDCKYILRARNSQYRIHITIFYSVLEEPLFGECNDFASFRDGNSTKGIEIVRWCGVEAPYSITSLSDTLFFEFHSDEVVQRRGFNFSFIEFKLPGCPPTWIMDPSTIHCYKNFDDPQRKKPWLNAQRACTHEQANLITFETSTDYDFVSKEFSTLPTFPWIGYSDVSIEGEFEGIQRGLAIWPKPFPTFNFDHKNKDCVFLNWKPSDSDNYGIDDCTNRRSFICKKRRDGSTIPSVISNKFIRNGFYDESFDYTILLACIVLLILLLIILWIIYLQYKKRKNQTQIQNLDRNQRLVVEHNESQPMRSSIAGVGPIPSITKTKTIHMKSEISKNNTIPAKKAQIKHDESLNSPRISLTPNQPAWNSKALGHVETNRNEALDGSEAIKFESVVEMKLREMRNASWRQKARDNSAELAEASHNKGKEDDILNDPAIMGSEIAASMQQRQYFQSHESPQSNDLFLEEIAEKQKISSSIRPKVFPRVLQNPVENLDSTTLRREVTQLTTATQLTAATTIQSTGSRLRSRRKSIDRPHIGVLDSVSAISLDEFWQK